MATADATSATAQSLSVTSILFESGKYSDLKVTCQGRSFNVHRAVICLQSKPFAAMVDGKFKEAVSGVVDLPNDDADVVEKMIEFMYYGKYSDGRDPNFVVAPKSTQPIAKEKKTKYTKTSSTLAIASTAAPSSPESALALLLNARVYVLAELYDVPSLKELAKNKYEELVPTEWNSPSFVTSLKLLYENTPENDCLLKNVAIKAAADHIKELVDRGEFVALCKENGEIAFDVLKAPYMATPTAPPSEYQIDCPRCGFTSPFMGSRGYGTEYYCENCDTPI